MSLPSARPLNCGITTPMTRPRSVAPAAIAARAAARISAGSTAGGRNASRTLIWLSSTSARSARCAFVNCSNASRRSLIPLRMTSTTSSSVGVRASSSSRFFRLARMVPRTSARAFSWDLRAALSAARKESASCDTRDPGPTAGLADGCVHLPLLLLARLLVVPVLSEIRQDPGLFALFLEAFERPLEALVVVDDHFGHAGEFPPLAPGLRDRWLKRANLDGDRGWWKWRASREARSFCARPGGGNG